MTRPATSASARKINALLVLNHIWRAAAEETFTANELMAVTGLTRATVLAVCDDLLAQGWLSEQQSVTTGPSTGRPPRRFAFRSDAAHVVAVDVGDSSIRGAVVDLHGRILGRGRQRAGFGAEQRAQRDEAVRTVIADSLAAAAVSADTVLIASFGLAAPVAPSGLTPLSVSGNYWSRMSMDPSAILADYPGWTPMVNNDANLAALAVGAHGEADPSGSYAVLLAGERFGTGIVAEGRLVLGCNGAAGDMHFLTMLTGVESQEGLAASARRMGPPPLASSAVDLFAKASSGDLAATQLLRELADRLARVVAVLASLLNPEQVVVGGAIAESAGPLIELCQARLPDYAQLPPRVTASRLGGDVVLLGAVRAAIDRVAETALDVKLPPTTS